MEKSLEAITKGEISEILKDIIKEHGLEKYDLEISRGAEKGDGYMSCIVKVDVTGENKKLSLIVKCTPRNPRMRSAVPLNILFKRENYMYATYFPAILTFQQEKNIEKPFLNRPKCFKTSSEHGKEVMVLENVKELGFKLWNRKKYMPEDHIILVFQEYGKFHGTTFALRDQKKEYFKTFEVNLNEVFNKETAPPGMLDQVFASLDKLRDVFDPENEKEYYERTSKVKDFAAAVYRSAAAKLSDFPVVCHGDCWCNNMMFAYEDIDNPSKPTKLCLLDFQMSKLGSPVLDLSYFFYVSANPTMMKNMDHYLKIYYQSLCDHVRALGSDPNQLFTFENLLSEWKKYSIIGFMAGSIAFKAMLWEDDELDDMSDLKADVKGLFDKKSKSDVIVKKRIKDVLVHMLERDFIPKN